MTPRPQRGRSVLLLLLMLAAASPGANIRNRSTSSSGQFVIYCDDRDLRSRVVGFVEEVKEDVLHTLHERDGWQMPIVLSLDPSGPNPPAAPVTISLVVTPAGPKVDVAVRIGDDPGKIVLQRQIIRALLLEMAHRDRMPIKSGTPCPEAPWWLTEGIMQLTRNRGGAQDSDVFKSIVNTEKLPALEKFISQPPMHLDDAAGIVDRACSMALVDALLHLPNGPENLGRFVRAWPDSTANPFGALAKHFPTLTGSPQSLAKWWTLQLASLARPDQWRSLPPPAAEAELAAAIELDIAIDKTGKTARYTLADFDKYLRLPAAKQALRVAQLKIVTLSSKADAFYRPILAEYEEIIRLLAAGKTKGIAARLTEIQNYRKTILARHEKITDYLNWYEATQTRGITGEFDKYLRAVERLTPKPGPPEPADPRISEYLDSLTDDFAPLRPNMIPGLGSQPPRGGGLKGE